MLKQITSVMIMMSMLACSSERDNGRVTNNSSHQTPPPVKTFAGIGSNVLLEILALDEVKKVIKDIYIVTIESSTYIQGSDKIYTIAINYQGNDIGLNGPQGVPCVVIIEASYIDGLAGTTGPTDVSTDTICAAAAPL
jgi:hypothetical protein